MVLTYLIIFSAFKGILFGYCAVYPFIYLILILARSILKSFEGIFCKNVIYYYRIFLFTFLYAFLPHYVNERVRHGVNFQPISRSTFM